eukprot:Rmarinus@m.12854
MSETLLKSVPAALMASSPSLLLVLAGVVVLLGLLETVSAEAREGYECGFGVFGGSRGRISQRFYALAVLFLLFDVELAAVFPLVCGMGTVDCAGWLALEAFLVVLTLGYVYEWSTSSRLR